MPRPLVLSVVLLAACGPAPMPPSANDHHDHEHGSGHKPPGAHAHGSVHHDFSDAARWSKMFDDPARDAWQKPDEVVKLLAIEPGMTVVDLGAGTGYFEKRLSATAGPNGRVLALDPEPNMVTFMRDRFAKEGLANTEARTCPTDGTGLEAGSVDRLLIVDTWHHIENREAYAKRLTTVLRPGGFVMVVDFTLEAQKGPPKKHRIAPDVVAKELEAGGLTVTIAEESLPDQYVTIGRK